MKKLIGVLGLVSLFTVGMIEEASAQFGGGGFPMGGGDGRQVSARAKGAIIGGGLGAAAGAVIHRRDPVAGGIVGAVLGAGAGYAIGNAEDRRRTERVYNRRNGYSQQRGGYYRKGYGNRGGYYSNNNYRGRSCR